MKQWVVDIVQFINGFRKWTIMVLLMVVGVVFRISGHVSGAEMVDLLRYTAVAFMAGNSIEHMAKAVQEWVAKKK